METFHLTPPNICALLICPSYILYVKGAPEAVTLLPANLQSVEQFETTEAAAERAVELGAENLVSTILGSLNVETVTLQPDPSMPVKANDGEEVTFTWVVEPTTPGCSLTYRWLNPNGQVIAGATQETLTVTTSPETVGDYSCQIFAETSLQSANFECTFTLGLAGLSDMSWLR